MANKLTGAVAVVGGLKTIAEGAVQIGGGDVLQVKTATIARTDTTAKDLFTLPANAIVHALLIYGNTASDAGTTATIDVGKTGTLNHFLDDFDVTATQGAELTLPATAENLGTVGTSEIQVTGLYAESGTVSTTGGPWSVTLLYSVNNL